MATKTLFKTGNDAYGNFEIRSVDGVVQLLINGVPLDTSAASGIAGLTAVATPDGSDAGTTQTLANALKVKVNQIIAALQG